MNPVRPIDRVAGPLVPLICLGVAFGLGWSAHQVYERRIPDGPERLRALAAFKHDRAHYVGQSLTLIQSDRLDEAEDLLLRGLDSFPSDRELRNNLAVVRLKQGRVGEGEALLAQVTKQEPDFTLAANNLGWARSLRDGLERQIAQARERVAPGRPLGERVSLLAKIGALQTQLGKEEDALASYLEALQLDPANPLAHNNAGVTLMRLGRSREAALSFSEAYRLDPVTVLYRNNLEWANRESAR